MFSTGKKKNQNERLLIHWNEVFNDSDVGKNAQIGASEDEILGLQSNGLDDNFEGELHMQDNTIENRVNEKIIANWVRKEVDSVVLANENRVHYAIWTKMDNMVIISVEMAMRPIIVSWKRGTNL